VSVETARQYFHDLNVLAVRPNTSLSLAMDARDPLSKVVGELEVRIPFLTGRVDRQARQLSKRSPKVVTFGALRQSTINMVHGMAGIQYGSRPVPLEETVDLAEVANVAKDWLTAYYNEFAADIVDRENSLAGSAPVLAVVGAIGKEILEASPADRPAVQAKLLAGLQQVNWSKGAHWAGIAGKFTASGKFSVGGTKEVGYAIFNVLTDPSNAGYLRVRQDDAASPAPDATIAQQPVALI
jgi:DNA sulfur modification protein DndB